MLRIKGRVGDWPVDLTIEMDAQDWKQLAAHLPAGTLAAAGPNPAAAAVARPVQDGLWETALTLLQNAGEIEGPRLLAELAALAGGEGAGKRLLVRLRHSPLVKLESGAHAPIYRWVG
ncbi:hypothetical protein [Pseudomonas sp. LRF_L74]|uniref:hypothetical protein n=1 Tax=Pseudomonas sp. LRF_L74 TaxID=3369422 RepID=UPI003F5E9CEF